MARAATALLLLVLCGCSGASPTTTPGEPGGFVDPGGSSPAAEQCSLPVEQRTGGWFCPNTR